jgi:hypothetical protein
VTSLHPVLVCVWCHLTLARATSAHVCGTSGVPGALYSVRVLMQHSVITFRATSMADTDIDAINNKKHVQFLSCDRSTGSLYVLVGKIWPIRIKDIYMIRYFYHKIEIVLFWYAVSSGYAFLRLERSLLRWRRTAVRRRFVCLDFMHVGYLQLSSGNSAPNSGNNHHLTIQFEGSMHSFKRQGACVKGQALVGRLWQKSQVQQVRQVRTYKFLLHNCKVCNKNLECCSIR